MNESHAMYFLVTVVHASTARVLWTSTKWWHTWTQAERWADHVRNSTQDEGLNPAEYGYALERLPVKSSETRYGMADKRYEPHG